MSAINSSSALEGATAPLWAPLRTPVFRRAWILSLLSYIGIMIADLAAIWLLTSLTDRADIIAIAQSSSYLALIVLAIPSGVLADLLDRRLLLIAVHLGLIAVLAGFLIVSSVQNPSLWPVLVLIVGLGAGAAMSGAMWQIATPELAPERWLGSAVTLVLTGYNVSRLLGPAAGGLIVISAGPKGAFWTALAIVLTNAGILANARWPSFPRKPLSFGNAFSFAVRSIWTSAAVRRVSIIGFSFAFCACAIWSLLPVIARTQFGEAATGFGLLTSSLGFGAILAAGATTRLRKSFGLHGLLALSCCGLAIGAILLATSDWLWISCLLGIGVGGMWMCGITAMSVAAREFVLPNQRSQSVTVYLVAFAIGMVSGSAVWGRVALINGFWLAIAVAAVLLLAIAPLLSRGLRDSTALAPIDRREET